jgi:transcriptional regulator with XRE-family HTH domain
MKEPMLRTDIGRLVHKIRSERKWSREKLLEAIQENYGEELSIQTLKNIESGKNATLRTFKLVFGALLLIPKDDLNSFFVKILQQEMDSLNEVKNND